MKNMNDPLTEQLKYLRLKGLQAHWDDYLKLAAEKNFSHDRLLRHVIEEERRIKCESARQFRLKKARIPEALVLETFPFARQPKLSKKKIMALYDSMGYMKEPENIIIPSPPTR